MYTHTPQLIPLFPLQLGVEVAESTMVLNVPGDSGEVDVWFFRRVQLYCRITQTYFGFVTKSGHKKRPILGLIQCTVLLTVANWLVGNGQNFLPTVTGQTDGQHIETLKLRKY